MRNNKKDYLYLFNKRNILLLILILFISRNTFAVTNDTPGGIIITNSVIVYFGSGPTSLTSTGPTIVVKTNCGLSTLNSPANYIGPKTLDATFNYYFTNNGNVVDPNIRISLDQIILSGSLSGSPADWRAEIWTNWNGTWGASSVFSTGIIPSGLLSVPASAAVEDAVINFQVRITAASNAKIRSWGYAEVNIETLSTNIHFYTGDNLLSYGGFATTNDSDGPINTYSGTGHSVFVIQGAEITIRKYSSISSSDLVSAGYSGSATDPVSGSIITYTLTYTNSGNGDATSLWILDSIPDNTTYIPSTMSITNDSTGASWKIISDINDGDEGGYEGYFDGTMVRFGINNTDAEAGDKGKLRFQVVVN